MSECPHPDCSERISRTQFACRAHWVSLPVELRRRIWRNYRAGDPAGLLLSYDEADHYWSTNA